METLGQDLETMRRVPLAAEHVDAICGIGGEKIYPAGSIVMDIGEPMDRFVYILEGEIEVVNPYTDERLLQSSLGPTQFMGEIAFLNRGTNYLKMRACKDTRVIEAPRADVLELMSRIPELSDHIITVFAARRRKQFELGNAVSRSWGQTAIRQCRRSSASCRATASPSPATILTPRTSRASRSAR